MQSQQQTKGEVIAELRGKTDSFTIKEINQNGVKMENNDIGTITGKWTANFMETVSISMKQDGTSDWEGRGIQMAGNDMLVVTGRGKGRTGPDGNVTFEGEQKYMTQSKNLAWLNTTKAWIEGKANRADQTFTAKIYAKK